MEDYGIPVRPEYVVQGDYIYQGDIWEFMSCGSLMKNQQLFCYKL